MKMYVPIITGPCTRGRRLVYAQIMCYVWTPLRTSTTSFSWICVPMGQYMISVAKTRESQISKHAWKFKRACIYLFMVWHVCRIYMPDTLPSFQIENCMRTGHLHKLLYLACLFCYFKYETCFKSAFSWRMCCVHHISSTICQHEDLTTDSETVLLYETSGDCWKVPVWSSTKTAGDDRAILLFSRNKESQEHKSENPKRGWSLLRVTHLNASTVPLAWPRSDESALRYGFGHNPIHLYPECGHCGIRSSNIGCVLLILNLPRLPTSNTQVGLAPLQRAHYSQHVSDI